MVRKGVRCRLGRLWGISRISHLLFLWGLRCDDGAGWSAISKVGLLCVVSCWVDDIDLLGGRSDNLYERLCCMVVVASDLRACGAFVWLTVCKLFGRLNYNL